MVVVIDTRRDLFGMPRVVAVAMERELVTQFFSTSFAFGGDVVNFHLIPISEREAAPATFPLLFLKQFPECST